MSKKSYVMDKEVALIRDLYSTGNHTKMAIARMTGRSYTTILDVLGPGIVRPSAPDPVKIRVPEIKISGTGFIKPPTLAQLMAGR